MPIWLCRLRHLQAVLFVQELEELLLVIWPFAKPTGDVDSQLGNLILQLAVWSVDLLHLLGPRAWRLAATRERLLSAPGHLLGRELSATQTQLVSCKEG